MVIPLALFFTESDVVMRVFMQTSLLMRTRDIESALWLGVTQDVYTTSGVLGRRWLHGPRCWYFLKYLAEQLLIL